MPVYSYRCQQCGVIVEHRHSANERCLKACVHCGGILEKALNRSVALHTPQKPEVVSSGDDATGTEAANACTQGHINCPGHQLADALIAQEQAIVLGEEDTVNPGEAAQS